MPAALRAFLCLAALATSASAQELRFFSVGSGNIGGGYYEATRAICRAINQPRDGLRCSPEPTQGSLQNLAALKDRQVEFALVQSDWHRSAYEGLGVFSGDGPMTDLRSVMSLYLETVTVLARRDAGIVTHFDLLGKRVDLGHPSSGRRATLGRLLEALELSGGDFQTLTELTDGAAIDELCAGRLDAVVLIVGHPNAAVGQVLRDCDVTISPFVGPRLRAVFDNTLDYVESTIPRSAYPELDESVPTYAVTATVVTMAETDPELVEAFVARTLDSLDDLEEATSLLSQLDPEEMATQGLTAPLHDAARRTFEAFPAG